MRHRGSVLIIAMVILFAITALVLTLNRQARTQSQAAANDLASQQADSIERGAEAYAFALATDYRTSLNTITDNDYAAIPVGTGYFWIIKPNFGDDTQSTFGLMDEASKLDLNTVTPDALTAMSGMTDQIAGSIVDWVDTDDDLSANGAESSTYAGLSTPYNAKNAPFESVDEMSLLYGMTPELMYGDPTAASSGGSGNDQDDYYLAHGLSDYFTAWDTASLNAADGTARIDMTDRTKRTDLKNMLDTLLDGRGNTIMQAAFPTQRPGGRPVTPARDIFMLADRANLTADDFQAIEDHITSTPVNAQVPTDTDGTTTTTTPTGRKGLININTAPKAVLMTLTTSGTTSLIESDIDALIAARQSVVATNAAPTMSWVKDALGTRADQLGNFITAQGAQFSAEIVSVSGNGRGFRHVKIVIDTSTSPPSIIFRHDITDHGWPFDPQLLAQIKTGQQISQGTTQGASLVSGGMH